jgi:hypothetical protein
MNANNRMGVAAAERRGTMNRVTRRSILAATPAALALAAVPARASKNYGPGVTDTEIKIGNTGPYSGPASSYGTVGRVDLPISGC